MRVTIVTDKNTGETHNAIYSHNRLGNLRYWVAGKFYSDREFAKRFEIVGQHSSSY